MSAVEDPGYHRRVAELAATPGAVPVLATLQDHGGSATREILDVACLDTGDAGGAVQWLVDVGLARHHGQGDEAGTATTVELTEAGRRLTRSLTNLAEALAEPADDQRIDATQPPQ